MLLPRTDGDDLFLGVRNRVSTGRLVGGGGGRGKGGKTNTI